MYELQAHIFNIFKHARARFLPTAQIIPNIIV